MSSQEISKLLLTAICATAVVVGIPMLLHDAWPPVTVQSHDVTIIAQSEGPFLVFLLLMILTAIGAASLVRRRKAIALGLLASIFFSGLLYILITSGMITV